MNPESNPELKLQPLIRLHLEAHPNGTEIFTVLVRIIGSQPPAKWSHLEWGPQPVITRSNGQTIWSVKVPQPQLLNLAASPEIGAIGGWEAFQPMASDEHR